MPTDPSVTLAVLTYHRPEDIAATVPLLLDQLDRHRGTGRVLVIDNDAAGSARETVTARTDPRLEYLVEPTPGIAAARNRALAETETDLIVFIDDDERPSPDWLAHLVAEYHRHPGTLGVFGLVESTFATEPDPWLVAGNFFQRRRPPTGTSLDVVATNNLLLDMRRLRELGLSFDNSYGISGGSDTMFSREARERGGTFHFSREALVHDIVPAERATREWVLSRARRSGNSWSRTLLQAVPAGPRRFWVRLRLTGSGLARVGGGALRWALGVITRNTALHANGLRNLHRGSGMLSGAWGHTHVEYARAD